MMDISGRLSMADIHSVCKRCAGEENNPAKARLFELAMSADDRTAYNALWIMTHFSPEDKLWLLQHRDELTDCLLTTPHTGKRRLILCLFEGLPLEADAIRSDYLDFCLAKINSTEPYGVRALCIKQAFAICRVYPELIGELMTQMDMMDYGDFSTGLRTARKNVLAQIRKLKLTK